MEVVVTVTVLEGSIKVVVLSLVGGVTVVRIVCEIVKVRVGWITVVHTDGAGKRIALQSSLPPSSKIELAILSHARMLPNARLNSVIGCSCGKSLGASTASIS